MKARISTELKIANSLKKKKKTLAVAESCTGGLVSHRITDVPGSSKYFKGGVVAYSNMAKVSILAVPSGMIKKCGAVSREVALAMAEGARSAFEADIAAAVTGIAGPSGGTAEKPVGLAYMAVVSGKVSKTRKVNFKGGRSALKIKFSDAVLELIQKNI
ncbi:MAG: nicotinamide-nucleotide amidohydrolase family protein [Candidatus Omnitrophota bacterium]